MWLLKHSCYADNLRQSTVFNITDLRNGGNISNILYNSSAQCLNTLSSMPKCVYRCLGDNSNPPVIYSITTQRAQLKGSVEKPNISIYFSFFPPITQRCSVVKVRGLSPLLRFEPPAIVWASPDWTYKVLFYAKITPNYSGVGMGIGFAPTWLRQVSPPPVSQNQFNHWWCSISDVLFTGGRGVSDFNVLKYS